MTEALILAGIAGLVGVGIHKISWHIGYARGRQYGYFLRRKEERDEREADAIAQYDYLREQGLSDGEARATAWPEEREQVDLG